MKEIKTVKEKTLAKVKIKEMCPKKITSGSSWAQ